MAEYERSGMNTIDTLREMTTEHYEPIIREVAELCLSSIENDRPITERAEQLGYFTPSEAQIMQLGQEYGQLPEMVGVILDREAEVGKLFKEKMAPIVQNFAISILFIFVYSFMESLSKVLSTDYLAYSFSMFVIQYKWPIAIMAVTAMMSYVVLKILLTGELREQLRRFGFARYSDHLNEISALRIVGALAKCSVPPEKLYTALRVAFEGNRHITSKVDEAMDALEYQEFSHSLKNVFRSRIYANIRAKSPDGSSKNIGEGCESARRLTIKEYEFSITRLSNTLDFAVYLFMGFLAYPLLLMSMGVGASV